MNTKFDKLYRHILIESKLFKKKHSIIKEDIDVETLKANFEAITKKIDAAFAEYGQESSDGLQVFEDDDYEEPEWVIEWNWENKDGNFENLTLHFDPATGRASYDDNGSNDNDFEITDVEETAQWFINEYLFNPEYGGIGCEDRTLDEVVPELLEKWKNNNSSDFDWDSMDLDEVAEEFIDENYDNPFETEEDIADELSDWLDEHYSKEEED